MNVNKISILAILLWVGLILVLGIKFIKGSVDKGEDGRVEINLTKSEKILVLGEMRQLLKAVQGIVNGIEQNDHKAIAEAALGGGTKMMIDDSSGLMLKLPLNFKTQGVGVHKYFDKIAEEAQKNPGRDKIISMLNTQLQSCVSCHAGYQFKTN
ncbi:MAG: hypothetical protein OEV78_04310 [Spirochaetia bacterium]|nr:hypothetical protein [Spirochaetia bacterium]